MHKEVHRFIKYVKSEYPYKFRLRKVLEAGSQNINGTPRRHFLLCNYIGVDMMRGKGVDIVGDFSKIDLFPQRFAVVISCEMLEHDINYKSSLLNMYKHLNDGGLLIVTCAGPHRPEHGTRRTTPADSPATTDYYRNLYIEDFEAVLPRYLFKEYVIQYARGGNDLQFYGIKKIKHNPTSAEIYKKLVEGNFSKTN